MGIGASAGGFEALKQLTSHLPKDTGMSFVVVQHLDPHHKSNLTELLSHSAALPVKEISKSMELGPNQIYILPSNAAFELTQGRLRLLRRKMSEMPPMPVDRFFRSLADDQQDAAIGIVLSGTGSDGTLGLEAIKGQGGVTFAQDKATSRFFGMPGSADAAGTVDFVLPPQEIADHLARIFKRPYLRETATVAKPSHKLADMGIWEKQLGESDGDLQTVFGLLQARTGVDFALYKHTTLKRRIVRRMILHKLDNLDAYVRLLEANTSEVDALFNDLLISVTGFFRDPRVFQVLQQKVFPKILKGRSATSPLRAWVCGCSTGEEAYSLAICLVEFFESHRIHRPVQIFATDISDAGIESARLGIYPEGISRDISPERLKRFFTKVNGRYQVHKSIRDMCIFARQNVVADPPFSNLDLITCRNLLIYLGPVLQHKVVPCFHYGLRPNGFLVLGTSETIGASGDLFIFVDRKCKIYSKKLNFSRPEMELFHKDVPTDIKHYEPPRDSGSKSSAKPARGARSVEHLKQELETTRQSLHAFIQEQDRTNENLKSASEEIQSSNEELQNRNNELTMANNDLNNLLSSVNVAVLMLGNDLTIRRFTTMAERIFNLIPSDVGRRLSDLNRSALVPDLEQCITQVIDNLTPIEREVQARNGHWFSLRIRPYRTRENKIDGAVVLLMDIDEMKPLLDEVLSTVKQPMLRLGLDLKVKQANASFYDTFGLKPADVENRLIYEMGDGKWNIPQLQTLLEAILPDNRHVNDFELEAEFPVLGRTKIRINARRLAEETRGSQLILLTMDVLPQSAQHSP
ncbi:MAG TPA: chemotaxis protein CheB [Verrucomicrobiae bacterium]|nr:chemotaxis protein CheB [Verrucomicrobiae bacterium]